MAKEKIKWTSFWDMHSGGGCKESPYEKIYIEAPEDEAIVIFYNKFGHNPHRVTCTCCGEDYSIDESDSLGHATAYHRGCKWDKSKKSYDVDSGMAISDYKSKEDVLIISNDKIKDEWRSGEVPEEGYVWV